jgi:hypothetical protein
MVMYGDAWLGRETDVTPAARSSHASLPRRLAGPAGGPHSHRGADPAYPALELAAQPTRRSLLVLRGFESVPVRATQMPSQSAA